MIIFINFTNPDKIYKVRKFWSSFDANCLVKTNVTGNNHFKQVIIWIKKFHYFDQNKHIFNWLRRVRYLLSYNL